MKQLSTIFGVGVISMAVALAPAFAQQTKPQEPAATAATVQPKTDAQATPSVPATKDDKSTSAKPGDAKAPAPVPSKPATDVKIDKGAPVQPTDTKAKQAVPAKPGEVKSTAPALSKPPANVKADKTAPAKSAVESTPTSTTGKSELAKKGEKQAVKKARKHLKRAKVKHHKQAKPVAVKKDIDTKAEKGLLDAPPVSKQ